MNSVHFILDPKHQVTSTGWIIPDFWEPGLLDHCSEIQTTPSSSSGELQETLSRQAHHPAALPLTALQWGPFPADNS